MTKERRASQDLSARNRKLTGYAAVFNQTASIGGEFTESIAPGAFRAALASNPDILALVDHDSGKVLARTKSGTLRLWEDERGLAYEIDLPQTTLGHDLIALAERGDLGGVSFGFTVPDGGDAWAGSHRTLSAVNLFEISIVQSFPAYSGTSVAARARKGRDDKARRVRIAELGGVHYGAV
ncbi:HK97 family phage prohead protease [Sinorhizobium meliloti]|uniref:HK97 family phage prohead protease n=1 Tax=Rhizobium meliloti TaxID=382 RepID=UPI003D64A4BF